MERTWYTMTETIGEYIKGETYASLPEELMADYPDSFTIEIETISTNENPFE